MKADMVPNPRAEQHRTNVTWHRWLVPSILHVQGELDQLRRDDSFMHNTYSIFSLDLGYQFEKYFKYRLQNIKLGSSYPTH